MRESNNGDAIGAPEGGPRTDVDTSDQGQTALSPWERDEIYRVLVNQAAESIVLIDAETMRFTEFNDTACRALGYSRDEFALLTLMDINDTYSPGELRNGFQLLQRVGEGCFETCHRAKDGSCHPCSVSNRAAKIRGRDYVVAVWRDITEHKNHEREIERLNRLYAALSELNRILVRIQSRKELFEEVCRVATERAGFAMAWIGVLDDETRIIVPAACAGHLREHLCELTVYSNEQPEGQGPMGRCLQTGKSTISNDFLADPSGAPWHALAAKYGYRAVASLPIFFHGETYGALAVYALETNVFRDEEVILLEEFAAAISVALESLERESQRKQAEEAANRERKFTFTLLENLNDGIVACNAEGKLVLFNRAARNWHACDALASSADEWSQRYQLYVPDGSRLLETHEIPLARAFAGEFITDVEIGIGTEDRHFRSVLCSGGPFYDAHGRKLGAVVVMHDICERKKAEEKSRLEEARIKFLLELSQMTDQSAGEIAKSATENAIQLTGSEIGYLAFLNEDESVLTMHYWSKEAMRECAIAEKTRDYPVCTTGLWGEVVRQRKPIITNDYSAPNPCKKGTPPGHVPIFRHMNVPVFDKGRIVAVAGVANKSAEYTQDDVQHMTLFMDGMWRILCRKRAEEQLRTYATELEQTNRELEKAKRATEAASRAKTEFLANMSHEIRTPMSAILGFSDLLMVTNPPPQEQYAFLEGIQRNGHSLLTLMTSLLELSRLEDGDLTIEKTEFALRPFLSGIVANAAAEAQKKGLRFEVDYELPIPVTIQSDPERLRQVLDTLLGNAVKFTERGEVRLLLRSIIKDDEDVQMCFSVADTGIGILREKINELFQPFMQADTSATRRYGGAGLGLAISARLAKTLGGSLEVTSEPGKGSIFTLTINMGPLKETLMPQNRLGDATAIPSVSPMPPQSPRLLLAEDDEDIQTVMRLLLKKIGLDVSVADDGQTACEMAVQSLAEKRPYDMIFMDIQMPRRNGYEATEWLRQQGWHGYIIALTAHALTGDREKCLAAGCDDYLAKPVFISGVRDVLERYLGYKSPPLRGAFRSDEIPENSPAEGGSQLLVC
jgi:PAS domain S-box-containing protein